MFISQRYKPFLLHFKPQKSSLNLNFCTTTSQSESFRVSYLISNLGFPPEAALKVAKRLRFNTAENPDSVINVFRSHGFSDSNIRHILRKQPWLISSRPNTSILPKLEFFLSKSASASDIVRLLTSNPKVLQRSLENHIIPLYELLSRFSKSDRETVDRMIRYSHNSLFGSARNVKLMVDYGVCVPGIAILFRYRASLLSSVNLLKSLEEVKGLGFDPSKGSFGVALAAIKTVTKIKWDEKVDTFNKWGWSHENVLRAFRIRPNIMLASNDKIDLVLSFWVNQMGWDSLALVKGPYVFAFNLQKRIIPRALVLEFLLKKGLRKKDASLVVPFIMSEDKFLNKFVLCFEEESAYLLKLYEENMNLASTKENTVIPLTKHVPH